MYCEEKDERLWGGFNWLKIGSRNSVNVKNKWLFSKFGTVFLNKLCDYPLVKKFSASLS